MAVLPKIKTMTYGQMPTREMWERHWDMLTAEGEIRGGLFRISLSTSDSRACDDTPLGDGEWKEGELYDACLTITTDHADNDAVMDLVSSIMQTLRFEWV